MRVRIPEGKKGKVQDRLLQNPNYVFILKRSGQLPKYKVFRRNSKGRAINNEAG